MVGIQELREKAIEHSRIKYPSDLDSHMLRVKREGYIEGYIEGYLEGREEVNKEIVQYALSNNKSIEDIVAFTGLSYEEVERLSKIS